MKFATVWKEAQQRFPAWTEKPCARYAPSPTGPLHLGNLRTALLAWLQARLMGARFLLRIEDLDQPRVRPESTETLMTDLRWLGLDWDEGPDLGGPTGPYLQSERLALYEAALTELKERGLVFPCYCSRKDIAEAPSAPHAKGSVYPGTCRTPRTVPGRTEAWRFRVEPGTMVFEDGVAGPQTQDLVSEVGDFVVRRADGLFAYQLAVVVDDALMGVSHVLRGWDLLDSTPRQIALFRALGLPVPTFWHVPLLRDEGGQRLSKREGSESVAPFREAGRSPGSVVGFLAASVGLVPAGTEITAKELVQQLTLAQFQDRLGQHGS